jgi:hypothetical protein
MGRSSKMPCQTLLCILDLRALEEIQICDRSTSPSCPGWYGAALSGVRKTPAMLTRAVAMGSHGPGRSLRSATRNMFPPAARPALPPARQAQAKCQSSSQPPHSGGLVRSFAAMGANGCDWLDQLCGMAGLTPRTMHGASDEESSGLQVYQGRRLRGVHR